MIVDTKKYSIILQNNATKDLSTFGRVRSVSESPLYLKFVISDGWQSEWWDHLPDGEYTYYAYADNTVSGTTSDYNNGSSTVLDCDIIDVATEERVTLRDLNPYIGLLRIGDVEPTSNEYDDSKYKTYYYEG